MVRAIRFGFCVALSCLAASPVLAKDEVEAFCTMELVPAMKVAMAGARQQRKDSLLRAFRDEVLAKFPALEGTKPDSVLLAASSLPREEYESFLRDYFQALEKRVQWSDGKRVLVALMHEVIASQPGSQATKSDLFTRVDETSIVNFSEFLSLLEKMDEREWITSRQILANSCGGDGLGPGGIAFRQGEKKVFAFCPGAVLRASVVETSEGMAWSGTVNLDALLFTAFHELGHLLGADRFSKLRPLHDGLAACLNSQITPFTDNYTDEVLADFWGAVALVRAMEHRGMSDEAAMDFVALNLSPFHNGSMFSPHHLPYGSRQQLVLSEVCRHLRKKTLGNRDCHLQLGTEEGTSPSARPAEDLFVSNF